MQVQLVTVARGQLLWGGEWWHRINSVITRVVHHYCSPAVFLPGFASLSRTAYLSRSFEIVLCHISEKDIGAICVTEWGRFELTGILAFHMSVEKRKDSNKTSSVYSLSFLFLETTSPHLNCATPATAIRPLRMRARLRFAFIRIYYNIIHNATKISEVVPTI